MGAADGPRPPPAGSGVRLKIAFCLVILQGLLGHVHPQFELSFKVNIASDLSMLPERLGTGRARPYPSATGKGRSPGYRKEILK